MLFRSQFEESESSGGVGVSVDHDISSVLVIAQPLSSIVAALQTVEVFIELLSAGAGHHEVGTPLIGLPAGPLTNTIGSVAVLITRPT